MGQDIVKSARARAGNLLGERLASKASDAFCLAYGYPAQTFAAGVGATEKESSTVQNYSSRGPAGTKTRPHFIAPGGIHKGVGITSCLTGGGFGDCGAGTSFAAPHVAGMLALLLERDPNLTPDELRETLLNACTSLNGIDVNTQGRGLVSLARVT